MKDNLLNKIRGSLIAGACGDALGYAIEFVAPYREIESLYGPGGLKDYDLSYPWLGGTFDRGDALISDDTQMTLYTAEGLLEAVRSGQEIIPVVRDAYLLWFGGQTGIEVAASYESELAAIPDLNARRAPGNTCLTALLEISSGKWPENNSKGCGGIMRVAPIGLYGVCHNWTLEEICRIAGDAAELTHLHPLSTYSSAALAVMIALCVREETISADSFAGIVSRGVEVVRTVYGADAPCMKEFVEIVGQAVSLTEDPRPDWEVIETSLGGGWVAEETLAIALFCVLRHIDDVERSILSAVNHGGDSDSTGAVAGNLIGAIHGFRSMPRKFVERVQFKDLLLDFSDRLAD